MLRKICALPFFILTLFFITSVNAQADTIGSLFRHPGDPIGGDTGGKVTVVEFFDYDCSHCANMVPTIDSLIKANPKVRFVFKVLPIRGEGSAYAARAALAANLQGKFSAFSHALFSSGKPLNEATMLEIAKSLNLDIPKFKQDMTNEDNANHIDFNLYLASYLKVPGTPAFFIGPTNAKATNEIRYAPGELSQKDLQDAINEAMPS